MTDTERLLKEIAETDPARDVERDDIWYMCPYCELWNQETEEYTHELQCPWLRARKLMGIE